MAGSVIKVYNLSVALGDEYEDTEIVLTDSDELGRAARFVQLEVTTNAIIAVKYNDNDDAVQYIDGPAIQVFDRDNIRLEKIAFANTSSGNPTIAVQLLVSR